MKLLELDDKIYKIPNKVMEAFEDLCDYIKDLKEENKTLKELNVCVGCNNNPDYKSRIDKAIEYLEHEQFKRIILGFGRDKYIDAIKNKTIEILKGE